MGATSIEWTEQTWNPVAGCEVVSPGCAHCYAATMTRRLESMGQADYAGLTTAKHFNGVVRTLPHKLDIPFRWKKPRMVFVNSMSDLFHEDVPNEFIANVFATMYECHWHTFQVLTKRAERLKLLANPRMPWAVATLAWNRMRQLAPEKAEYVPVGDVERDVMDVWPLPNVWLGVSAEDQKRADERIPHLLNTSAAVRFLSCEPLLEHMHLFCEHRDWIGAIGRQGASPVCRGIDWVIIGGESGHGARPCNVAWIRSLVAQCQAAGVPAFVKQIGTYPIERTCECGDWESDHAGGGPCATCCQSSAPYDGCELFRPTSNVERRTLIDRKGGDPDEWPSDIRIREFPEVLHAASGRD